MPEDQIVDIGQPAPEAPEENVELAEAPVEEPVAEEPVAPEPEEPKAHEPPPSSPRFKQIYWENKEKDRKIEALAREIEEIKQRDAERTQNEARAKIAMIERDMAKAAEENDIAEYNRLNLRRLSMGAPEQIAKPVETATPKPESDPGKEYMEFYTTLPENVHLLMPEAKGGSFETGDRIHKEMQANPVWAKAYHEHPDSYWEELSNRVSAAKPAKPAPGSPVEGVVAGSVAAPKGKWTVQSIAEKEGGTVREIEHIANQMYPNDPNPVARYVDTYSKQMGGM